MKNSRQLDSDFDTTLAQHICSLEGAASADLSMPGVKKEYDFAFTFSNKLVVVEVEKANWEKVLYDFLKAHIYFGAGADFVVVVVPTNYVHKEKSKNSFRVACQRYDQCLEYGFGSRETLERILLVGYEQALRDGRTLTPALREEYIAAAEREEAADGTHDEHEN